MNSQEAASTALTSSNFLAAYPAGGAYTTARTACGGTKLFEWSAHVERTASSFAAIVRGPAGARLDSRAREALASELGRAESLRPRLEQTVGAAVVHFLQAHRDVMMAGGGGSSSGGSGSSSDGNGATAAPPPPPELKGSIFVGWGEEHEEKANLKGGGAATPKVVAHVTMLPSPPQRPIRVEVRGAPRGDPAAKTVAWIAERAPNEALMRAADVGPGGVNEFLLSTK